MASVLLICTGNICRSPMAEGLLHDRLGQLGIEGVRVVSSGVAGLERSPPFPRRSRRSELGIDISGHVARRFHAEQVADAELIITMTQEQSEIVGRLAPRAMDRTFTLKEFVSLLDHQPPVDANGAGPAQLISRAAALADQRRASGSAAAPADADIADPLGLGTEAFRAVAWELEQLTDRLVDEVFPEGWDAVVELPTEAGGAPSDFVADWDALRAEDPEVAAAMANEVRRERSMLRLIASENYASPAVLAALPAR